MNFHRGRHREEPEINLVPLIDVMLVILIFLMATTTYSRFSALKIDLPTADSEKVAQQPVQTLEVSVAANGQYAINGQWVVFITPEKLAMSLRRAAVSHPNPTIVVNADAEATHQSVVHVMEAARIANFDKLTFTTQTPNHSHTP